MLKLVIVEDEELLRMGLTTYVDWEDLGYELVGEADNGLRGLEMIREKRPDVVITDIKMAHMDGIKMTETLKSEMPDLRIIIISGYDEFDYAKRALQAGVSEYILKPIKMDHLKEVVSKVRDGLLIQKERQAEYHDLKSGRQENLRIKWKHLCEKILIHQCGIEEVMEEYEKLGRHMGRQFYAVGVLAVPSFSVFYMNCDYALIMKKDKELEKLIANCLDLSLSDEEKTHLEVLRVNNGERLFCIGGRSREEVSGLIEKVKQGFRGVADEIEQLEIIFGQIGMDLEGMAISCRSARKISEQKFMKDWQETADTSHMSKGSVQFMNYDTKELCLEIKSGSEGEIEKHLRKLRDNLSRQNISSYLQLILVVSNIFNTLVKLPEEVGGSITEVIGNPQDYYQKLIGHLKREDMIDDLEELCIRLNQYFLNLSMNRKQEVMKRIDVYLAEHFSEEDLSMKDVADYAHISVSYLGVVIRKETGKTFIEYLTDIRMKKAKDYLANTNMKNYEVAEECGYSTSAYFSTVFKGAFGITPSEYRSLVRKNDVGVKSPQQ